MAVTSSVPHITDGLLASFHTTFDPLGVEVIDGPDAVSDNADQFIAVGYTGDPEEADDVAAVFTQVWADIGAYTRDEEAQIACCIVVLNGDSVKAARDACWSLFGQVELELRIDPTLGISIEYLEVEGGEYHSMSSDVGYGGRIVFNVHAKAQI